MCANGVTAGSRREGTPILAQQPPRRASGGRFGRVILLPRATGPGHVAVAVVVLFAPVDRNLPLRRRRHSPRRATLTHQRLEVRGIRHVIPGKVQWRLGTLPASRATSHRSRRRLNGSTSSQGYGTVGSLRLRSSMRQCRYPPRERAQSCCFVPPAIPLLPARVPLPRVLPVVSYYYQPSTYAIDFRTEPARLVRIGPGSQPAI